MNIAFNCPKCRQKLVVRENDSRQEVQCPRCQESVTIPRPAVPIPAPTPQPQVRQVETPPPPATPIPVSPAQPPAATPPAVKAVTPIPVQAPQPQLAQPEVQPNPALPIRVAVSSHRNKIPKWVVPASIAAVCLIGLLLVVRIASSPSQSSNETHQVKEFLDALRVGNTGAAKSKWIYYWTATLPYNVKSYEILRATKSEGLDAQMDRLDLSESIRRLVQAAPDDILKIYTTDITDLMKTPTEELRFARVNARIESTTKGGQPIDVIWQFKLIHRFGQWQIYSMKEVQQ